MKKLVVIGQVIPEPASTAAGQRMMQLIQLFEEWNYEIIFLTTAKNEEFSENIEFQRIELNDSGFDEIIKKLNPEIVLFDRFVTEEQFGWRVEKNCPKAIKILETSDLHFLRKARESAYRENKTLEFSAIYNDIFYREITAILRCDLTLIISEFELDLLVNQLNLSKNLFFYIPFLTEEIKHNSKKFDERKNFISIGNFLHEPNWQTVLQLKKIWPKIKKQITEAELHIYGAYATEKVYQLHNEKEGFLIKGRAKSVEKTFENYRVLLAPIPFGAGLKGKLWESMKFGLPNVTSTIGAEAMHKNLDWNGFVVENEEEFIQKSVELYSNKIIWENSQQNGYQLIEKIYKKDIYTNQFCDKIQKLSKNLDLSRQKNFVGEILKQNQFNASKYLSKWIEEKNRNKEI